ATILAQENLAGITGAGLYSNFQARAEKVKDDFVAYLIEAKWQGIKVAAYGAAAKGNTLLNFGGVRPDLLPYVVDLNPAKQGKYLPGSRVPIVSEDHLRDHRPDRVVILPWNLRDEVMRQLSYIREWGGKFVAAVPVLEEL
ncbi:MAG: methyltransferase C-terminal domain-containing protein, partial [Desulfomonilaceae bacterium]